MPQIQDPPRENQKYEKIRQRLSAFDLCCFTFMLYKIFIVTAWPDDIDIVVGWVNEKS